MTGIVYAQRPSKDVTRRIFVDMLHKLNKVAELSSYKYVGFGALEFIDFDMIHRELGIGGLTSIENKPNIARYEANKPYQCVTILGGHSTDMLTRVDWRGLNIVWLDYEDQLIEVVLTDIEYLCNKLTPGSVLAVTLNCTPGSLDGRRERLVKNVGVTRVPNGVDDDTLGDWGLAKTQQRILFSHLRKHLSRRTDQATWRQTLNIFYRDNARMQLIAGVINTPGMESTLDSCRFDSSEHFRGGAEALKIEVPYLTPHEQRLLRGKLPRMRGRRHPSLPGLDKTDVEAYAQFYKWIS